MAFIIQPNPPAFANRYLINGWRYLPRAKKYPLTPRNSPIKKLNSLTSENNLKSGRNYKLLIYDILFNCLTRKNIILTANGKVCDWNQ